MLKVMVTEINWAMESRKIYKIALEKSYEKWFGIQKCRDTDKFIPKIRISKIAY